MRAESGVPVTPTLGEIRQRSMAEFPACRLPTPEEIAMLGASIAVVRNARHDL
jgi:hypothetical protein